MAKKTNNIAGMSPFSEKDWQAEDDLRTLQRAAEIRADKSRFKAAQDLAKKKLASMASIAGANGGGE